MQHGALSHCLLSFHVDPNMTASVSFIDMVDISFGAGVNLNNSLSLWHADHWTQTGLSHPRLVIPYCASHTTVGKGNSAPVPSC